MKVVQLFKIYWPDNGGGIAAVMKSIVDVLQKNEQEIEQEIVVCHGTKGKKTAVGNYQGVKIRRCRQLGSVASTPVSLSFLIQTYQAAKDADLVVAHFPYPMIDLALLLGLYRGRYIVWWHCDISKYRGLLFFYKPLMKRMLDNAGKILIPYKEMAVHSEFLQAYRQKCMAVPFGLSRKLVKRADDYMLLPRRESSVCRILFIGRLVWYKGCDILLKALAKLEQEKTYEKKACEKKAGDTKSGYELTIVGNGPMREELQQMAHKLRLSSVRFTAKVPEKEKIRLIEDCDFLVLPSISKEESFAIVQLEAMAFGKPVINTKIPSGVPHVSMDGKTGITVEPGNVRQLADAIRKLGGDSKLREQYGKNAAAIVREQYVEECLQKSYDNLFRELGFGKQSGKSEKATGECR